MRKGWVLTLAIAGCMVFATNTALAGPTTHVVTHDNQDSWKISVAAGAVNFVPDPGCAESRTGLRLGALQLIAAGEGDAELRSTRYHRTYLRNLTALDYWSCVRKNNGQQGPFILLNVDNDGDNQTDDFLFFEPPYQSPGNGGADCAHQDAQANETWQHWDALSGCWWWASLGNAGTLAQPLSVYLAMFPDAAIVNRDGNHGGVRLVMGFGSPGDSFEGYVDGFRIADDAQPASGSNTNRNAITYDFDTH
jgi:hypothetical protein